MSSTCPVYGNNIKLPGTRKTSSRSRSKYQRRFQKGKINYVKHIFLNTCLILWNLHFQTFGYTPLDLAVSRPFSNENLDMIRVILECGAITFHRLQYGEFSSADSVLPEPCGPSLLHAVLARKTEGEFEEEVLKLFNICSFVSSVTCS